MAKNSVDDWSGTASSNEDIGGISILGTAPASNMDNALREMMAQIAATPLAQSASTMLTNLGATATGISALSAANTYALRALTEPSIILSQVDASGFNAKWTAALAIIAAAGGGEIIIDGNATLTTALDAISSSHHNLRVRPSHKGVTITGGAAITRAFYVSGGQNVSIDDLNIAMANNFSYGIDVAASGFRSRGVSMYSTGSSSNVIGFEIRASDSLVEDFYVYDMANGYRINPNLADIYRAQARKGRLANIGTRGAQALSGAYNINTIVFDDFDFPDSTNDFQPVRIDDEPGVGTIKHVRVNAMRILHPSTSTKVKDSIAIRGVEDFTVSNCDIDRYNDVNITADAGCEDGLIIGNRCRRGAWPISVGTGYDRVTLGVRNKRVHVTANKITDYRTAALAAYVTDNCSFTGNHATSESASPAYGFDYEDSTGIVARNNYMSGYGTSRYHDNNTGLTSWFTDREDVSGTQTLTKRADTVRNNTGTLTADPDLQAYLEADKVYDVDLDLIYSATSTANFRRKWTVPAGAAILYWVDNTTFGGQATFDGTTAYNLSGGGATTIRSHHERARIVMGGTAGVVSFDWAQQTAGATDITCRAGSRLIITRVSL